MKRGRLLGAAVAVVAATAVVVVLAVDRRDSKPAASTPPGTTTTAQPVVERPQGVKETCATRSMADFGPAFTDSANNLVVGPLAMIGGASFTSPSTVRDVHGQKYPLLVKAGHTVTIQVPPEAREYVLLGYGPLPQGEITLDVAHERVTFIACARGESSGSTANGRPVTFWSGALVADEPHCVPLDVYVDGAATPSRVFVELGARC